MSENENLRARIKLQYDKNHASKHKTAPGRRKMYNDIKFEFTPRRKTRRRKIVSICSTSHQDIKLTHWPLGDLNVILKM